MQFDSRNVTLLLVAAVVLVLAYQVMTTRENRTTGERLDAAVQKLDDGVDNAARELQDRTPAERARDTINDATDSNQR
jgi:hypothetical protein